MSMTIRGVLLVLLLLADTLVSAEFSPAWSENFYIEKIKFMDIFNPMQKKIEEKRDRTWDLEDGSKNPILEKQKLKASPNFWLMPMLSGRGMARTELAIRSDNLYLSAFTNGDGVWFQFKDGYIVKGTRLLSFGSQYKDLVGSEKQEGSEQELAWPKLVGWPIGREDALDAIDAVNAYDPDRDTTPEDDKKIKRALVTLIIVFIESQRFPHIRQQIHNAWTLRGAPKLDKKGAELVVNWKRTSCAILIWDATVFNGNPRWDSKEAEELKNSGLDINTPESAKAEIWPIIQSEKCSQ